MKIRRKSKFDHIKVGSFFNSVLVLKLKRVGVNNSIGAVFKCHCNKTFERSFSGVERGQISCKDCAKYSVSSAKHKYVIKDRRLYRIWKCMNSRCHNTKDPNYSLYGGRGIYVCDEWRDSDVEGFNTFYKEMGIYPTTRHSVDRRDGSKGYTKENCRWATSKEQMNNVRSNHLVDWRGETYTLQQISDKFNINSNKVLWRLQRGFPLESALNEELDVKVASINGENTVLPLKEYTGTLYGKECEVITLIDKGYNIKEISAVMGVESGITRYFIKTKLKLKMKHSRTTYTGNTLPVGASFNLTQNDLQYIFELKDRGVTNTEISKVFNKAVSTISSIVEKFYDKR